MQRVCNFLQVHYNGDTFLPGQANNFYIYPAIGLAVYATHAKLVTDEMFIEAARAMADLVNDKQSRWGYYSHLKATSWRPR